MTVQRLRDLHRELVELYRRYRHALPLRQVDVSQVFLHECQVRLDGHYHSTLEIIPWTSGCSWFNRTGGCFSCSLSAGCSFDMPESALESQIVAALEHLDLSPFDGVAILPYSSLDPEEFSPFLLYAALKQVQKFANVKTVILETRPEFIGEVSLCAIRELVPETAVAVYIGIETQSDFIRKYCIGKGFSWASFESKVRMLHTHGMRAGAYLLLKPPFLTELQAIIECRDTIRKCTAIGVDILELRAVEVVEHSLQHLLWQMGLYNPAWLWSILEVLRDLTEAEQARVTVARPEITYLSSNPLVIPYSHCESCRPKVDGYLRAFNETRLLPNYECDCRRIWQSSLGEGEKSLEAHLLDQYPLVIQRLRDLVQASNEKE